MNRRHCRHDAFGAENARLDAVGPSGEGKRLFAEGASLYGSGSQQETPGNVLVTKSIQF